MSPKERAYIEDALSHESFMKNQCTDAIRSLQDPELRSCVEEIQQKHRQIFDEFYNLI